MVTATDELLLLQDAAKQLLGSNTPSSVTIWRWGSQGLRGRSGERVLLRTETRFGRRCTTVDWMRRFLDRWPDWVLTRCQTMTILSREDVMAERICLR